MKITLTINCDNAAFDDLESEVSRILLRAKNWVISNKLEIGSFQTLYDLNGNNVGFIDLTE